MFFDVKNSSPHVYLTINKRTLPIGLVHVFVSLARRVGLDASPVNFPQKVLSHVRPPKEGDEPYHIDTCVTESDHCIVQRQDLLQYLSDHFPGIPQAFLPGYLKPVGSFVMLLRAADNIRHSRWHNRLPYDVAQSYQSLEVVIHLMFYSNIGVLAQALEHLELRPMDCAAFWLSKLAPLLSPDEKTLLEKHCEQFLENEALEAATVQRREGTQAVRYFVGLPFRHKKNDYVACIIQWDVSICFFSIPKVLFT
jgi:F-box protein 21